MKLDFSLILTLLAASTGIIWLIDKLVFEKSRLLINKEAKEPVLVEYAKSLFPVVFFVLALRSFVAEPFRIPSGSMMPNLLIGDFILVNKFNYGIRLPVINKKIVAIGEPKRGDVFVFRYPGMGENDPTAGTDYIKRVIGLPGDTISVEENRVSVNGVPFTYQEVGIFVGQGLSSDMTGSKIIAETMPGKTHNMLELDGVPLGYRNNNTWIVPEGHYFAMGDNRDRSADSREWGFVPEKNLVGRAMLIWLNCSGWVCSDSFNASRIGTKID
ncbi:MAG: signal peptidase I [Arenimonas sp.]|nr:signal peptidase I [Arenimonas sp.]MBP6309424.1 signal peptidase I [Arenimonas sp.]